MRFFFLFFFGCYLTACSGKKTADSAATSPVQPAAVREVVALGRIEPENKLTSLAAEASGTVTALPVAEGQLVQKGDLLLTLQHAVETAQVAQARSRLGSVQAQIGVAEAAVRSAQATAANLARTAARVSTLAAQGAETAQSRDDAQTALATQRQEVVRLQATAQVTRQQLRAGHADVAVAVAQRNQRFVRAPSAGRVLKWNAEVGGNVSPGTALGDFAPAGRLTVLCEVDELFATRVNVGQPAYVRPQGGTGRLAAGTVLFVAPYLKQKSLFAATAGGTEDRRVRDVRVLLRPQGGNQLLLNSRVECVIDVR